MGDISNVSEFEKITTEGLPNQEFYQLLEDIVAQHTINGSGNPNGVVQGNIDQLYRDTTGGPPVLYVNTDGGTTWVGV